VIFHRGNFSKIAFWPYARFFAVQEGGHCPSYPMVNTPMAGMLISMTAE